MHKYLRLVYYKLRELFQWIINYYSDGHRLVVLQANPRAEVETIWRMLTTPQKTVSTLRIGGNEDGGYCIPNSLSEIECFFSPGYGGIKTFEDELALKNIPSYICDGSYQSIDALLGMQYFVQKNIAAYDGRNCVSLQTLIEESKFSRSHNLGLQMDIEGDEYEILDSLETTILQKFQMLLIEFHDLELLVVSKRHCEKVTRVMKKLLETHDLVHVKANNAGGTISFKGSNLPNVIELSFLRKGERTLSEGEVHSHCNFLNDILKPKLDLPEL